MLQQGSDLRRLILVVDGHFLQHDDVPGLARDIAAQVPTGRIAVEVLALQRRSVTGRDGDVELDPTALVVRKTGKQLVMTAKEFRVLKLLMERAGKYVTKSDIEYALYSAENAAESNTTEVAIYSLRKKLGSEFIKSIRGVGVLLGAT